MHPRFQAAFSQLAENLQSALAPVLADAHFPALLTANQVTTLKQATGLDEDALAFALLPLAAACAFVFRLSPYLVVSIIKFNIAIEAFVGIWRIHTKKWMRNLTR